MTWRERWWLFCRGVLYVSMQAAMVRAVADFNIPAAFVVGSAISYVWSGNVEAQHGLTRVDRLIYGLGAGSGAVLGMAVGGWLGW